jgi:hypothetical protein
LQFCFAFAGAQTDTDEAEAHPELQQVAPEGPEHDPTGNSFI